MNSVLTVEDINSVNFDYINKYYTLNTKYVSEQAFNNVVYDFVIVSHSISGSKHTFSFKIHNDLWCGGYYLTKQNGEYLDSDATYDSQNHTLTFVTNESSVKLVLYLCSFASSFTINKYNNVLDSVDILYLKVNEVNSKNFNIKSLNDGSISTVSKNLSVGVNNVNNQFVLVLLKKSDLVFDLNTNLIIGIVNHVHLNISNDYLPGGALVDNTELDIIVKLNDVEIPVNYDNDVGDYCFDLDLSEKLDNKSIKLTVVVNESKYVNAALFSFNLSCRYSSADSFNSLKSLITAGAKVIELTNNIIFDNDLILQSNVYLVGNYFNVNLNDYSVIVEDNVNCKFEKINFVNGASCFIQHEDSKLMLFDCSFRNARIQDNYKGSVVSTLDSDNIVTEINDCIILNCHHSIWHGGLLSVKNTKALYNNYNDFVDTDYSAFLTAYDGTVEITDSTFDIDYKTTYLCENLTDVKFAESLISLGENTVLNGVSSDKLSSDNTLPLCVAQFNNQSHVYCEYYYPSISNCVITSPLLDYEDKNVCHTILGSDWVFKNNTQVTRKSNNTENNIRKIKWE